MTIFIKFDYKTNRVIKLSIISKVHWNYIEISSTEYTGYGTVLIKLYENNKQCVS